jgi:hypothetical protein
MTHVGDVIRQVETALNDTCCPPTPEEKEILNTILYRISIGSVHVAESR